MYYKGYHTEIERKHNKCYGCCFTGGGKCELPSDFPYECYTGGYIWVKDRNCQKTTVSVTFTFDLEAFKRDILEHIESMDLTKYLNQGS